MAAWRSSGPAMFASSNTFEGEWMSVHEGKAHTYNVYGEELAKKLNNNIK